MLQSSIYSNLHVLFPNQGFLGDGKERQKQQIIPFKSTVHFSGGRTLIGIEKFQFLITFWVSQAVCLRDLLSAFFDCPVSARD